jgi:hypothetical protein
VRHPVALLSCPRDAPLSCSLVVSLSSLLSNTPGIAGHCASKGMFTYFALPSIDLSLGTHTAVPCYGLARVVRLASNLFFTHAISRALLRLGLQVPDDLHLFLRPPSTSVLPPRELSICSRILRLTLID